MTDKTMNKEEVEQEIRDRGAEPGEWDEFGGTAPEGRHPQFVLDQVANLKAIKGVLETAIGSKQMEVERLKEKLVRLRYGGGS